MALLHEALEEKKFDVRLAERNVARGVVASEDVTAQSKKLADDSENAEYVSVDTLIATDSDSKSH